jgi:DNA polymerase kappa
MLSPLPLSLCFSVCRVASSAKAGLEKNQDEINRKIYEASKGSKFFENEKRSDERTTTQINAMLRRRDEKLSTVTPGSETWKTLERKIDERAIQLEASRDLSKVILHADMDMFYAAVELKRDPSLKGKAFGVGSGVLVTASYEARQFGVRSGMASHIALALCPHLIIVKNDMASYVAASKEVMTVFEDFDPTFAQMSLDEAYLDVTTYCEMNQVGVEEVVTQLRQEVVAKTGLTVSVGIAPNKMLAKISSDRNKPNGQFRVNAERGFIISFMQDLPCRKIPGIGRVTERILSSLGVETCGDIWTSRVMLSMVLNDIDWLLNAYLGIHSNIVEPSKREERKSVGREHTFTPTKDLGELKEYLRQSATQVGKDLERLEFRGKTVTLTCKTDAFRRFSRAKTMMTYQYKADDLYATACKLLDAEVVSRGGPFALRLIGVRITHLKDMRQGDKSGSLESLFGKSSTSPQKKRKEMDDNEQPLEEGGDVYANEMERAIQASLNEVEGTLQEEIVKKIRKGEEEDGKKDTVDCPICQKSIQVKGAPEQRNVLLNSHIDQCLQRDNQKLSPVMPAGNTHKVIKKKSTLLDSFVFKKV